MQRIFIIGDKWLYYKIYTGQKTADMILTDIIKPISSKMISDKLIDKWFFIRYADPKNHIRWRLHIKDNNNIGEIIQLVFNAFIPYVEMKQIYKIKADTYNRELERYGSNSVELAETLFWHDSVMIVKMLKIIENDNNEDIRWLFSLKAIDTLLNDFNFTLEKKIKLLQILSYNFGEEFGKNKFLINQLAKKYRNNKNDINNTLKKDIDDNSKIFPLLFLLKIKSDNIQTLVENIFKLNMDKKLNVSFDELISSYIHMMMNRIFKSKQRLHEMVIYDFLFRYYKSKYAKIKYNKLKKVS